MVYLNRIQLFEELSTLSALLGVRVSSDPVTFKDDFTSKKIAYQKATEYYTELFAEEGEDSPITLETCTKLHDHLIVKSKGLGKPISKMTRCLEHMRQYIDLQEKIEGIDPLASYKAKEIFNRIFIMHTGKDISVSFQYQLHLPNDKIDVTVFNHRNLRRFKGPIETIGVYNDFQECYDFVSSILLGDNFFHQIS